MAKVASVAGETGKERRGARRTAFAATVLLGILACAAQRGAERHGWMGARGIVVPHDSFPADCTLCHTGDDWNTLRADFAFDHLAETGVALEGAHARAECLRCHTTTAGRWRPSPRAAARAATPTCTRAPSAAAAPTATTRRTGGTCSRRSRATSARASPSSARTSPRPCFACHPRRRGRQLGARRRGVRHVPRRRRGRRAGPRPPRPGLDRRLPALPRADRLARGLRAFGLPAHRRARRRGLRRLPRGRRLRAAPDDLLRLPRARLRARRRPRPRRERPPDELRAVPRHELLGRAPCSATPGSAAAARSATRTTTTRRPNPDHAASGFTTSCEQCHGTGAWEPADFEPRRRDRRLRGVPPVGLPADRRPRPRRAGLPDELRALHHTRAAGSG